MVIIVDLWLGSNSCQRWAVSLWFLVSRLDGIWLFTASSQNDTEQLLCAHQQGTNLTPTFTYPYPRCPGQDVPSILKSSTRESSEWKNPTPMAKCPVKAHPPTNQEKHLLPLKSVVFPLFVFLALAMLELWCILCCLTPAAVINAGELRGGGGRGGSGEEGPSVVGMCVFMGDWVGPCTRLFVLLGSLHNEVVYSAAPSFQLLAGLSAWGSGDSPTLLPTLALSLCFSFWLKITNAPSPHPANHTHSHVW